MELTQITLPQCLRPSTLTFVTQHARAIAVCLGPTVERMHAALPAPVDGLGHHIRAALDSSEQVWERFFWLRLSHHAEDCAGALERALVFSDEDLLGLTAVLRVL